jgi:hypothetical protein
MIKAEYGESYNGLAHAIVHWTIGTRTRKVWIRFNDAFENLQSIVVLAGELAHQKESGSSAPTQKGPSQIAQETESSEIDVK